MKKFLIRLLAFVLCFFVIDKAFILVRDASPEREVDKRLQFILDGKINADIVVLGSSRGARSLIAKQIEDSTGRSAYNLAFPGSDVTFHEYVLRTLLASKGNRKPSAVVLVVDDSDELKTSKSLKFRFDRMYPLVKYKSVREEMVKRKEKKPIITELLVLHQLNKSNFKLTQRKFTKNDSIMPCGSMPISHQKKTFDKKYGNTQYTYKRSGELIQKVNAFKAIVAQCEQNGIEFIVAIPPNFRKVTAGFEKRMKQLVGASGKVWMYNSSKPEYSNPDYFFDNAHLQKTGSVVYTAEFASYLKNND